MHVGIRGSIYASSDLIDDQKMGFQIIHCMEIEKLGIQVLLFLQSFISSSFTFLQKKKKKGVVEKIRKRIGDSPLYISIDIDVLDPSVAPGTGTPEIGGFTSREMQGILRGLKGLYVVGADLMEVSPAYDHAEITSLAAANIIYELIGLMGLSLFPSNKGQSSKL